MTSDWAEVAGRRRRVYRLTEAGQRALGERRRNWRLYALAMGVVLGEPA